MNNTGDELSLPLPQVHRPAPTALWWVSSDSHSNTTVVIKRCDQERLRPEITIQQGDAVIRLSEEMFTAVLRAYQAAMVWEDR